MDNHDHGMDEFQEKLEMYRSLEERLGAVMQKQNVFSSKIVEIQGTIDSMESLSASDVLFPLGSAVYVKGSPEKEGKVVVEVGAGVALEKSADQAKAILEKRKADIQKAVDTLANETRNISSMMQSIEVEAQNMLKEREGKFKAASS